ncbi:MAG TPA: hypothetical protein VEC93_09370 [Anaerolineae bacterium]|nr:hypothetical protein [Anaerolineae bacterium]
MDLLRQVYEEIYGPLDQTGSKQRNLEELGWRMAKIIGRSEPWSYRALNGVLNGQSGYNLTEEMQRALQALTVQMDGGSPLQALIKPIQAYSINGHVKAGSIILGESRRCETCQVLFVPRVPWQKFCCPDHRESYAAASHQSRKE